MENKSSKDKRKDEGRRGDMRLARKSCWKKRRICKEKEILRAEKKDRYHEGRKRCKEEEERQSRTDKTRMEEKTRWQNEEMERK
jgi:hypothetical protein